MRYLFSSCLLAFVGVLASAAEPAPKPKIVVAPGGSQPAPAPTPTPVPPSPIPTSVRLSGMECEFLTLTGAGTGPISWDVTSPDSFAVPVKLFECKPKSSIPAWRVGATEPLAYDVGDLPTVQVFAVNTGRATLAAWGVADGKPVKLATFAIEANRGPQPPPDPGPGPKPPDPKPDTAPIPVAGFRVLIVYESADLARYPSAQNAILTAVSIRDYLNSHCVKGPDGRTSEARIWDKDVDGYSDSKLWGDALKRPRASIPWILISDGKTGYEGPLPANVADTLTLLRKYGGQ